MPNILGLWRLMLYKYSKTTETTNWQSSLSLQSITPSTKCQPSNTVIKLCQVWLLRRLYPPNMESGNFDCKGAANVSCRWAGGSVRLAWHVNTRNHKKRSHHHPRANIHFNWWFFISDEVLVTVLVKTRVEDRYNRDLLRRTWIEDLTLHKQQYSFLVGE